MTEQATSESGRPVRAAVVYRYPVYRDLITRVLRKADVDVAGAIEATVLDSSSLRALRPDVVVIYDPEANALLRDVAMSALLGPAESEVARVVSVGSEDEMIVLARTVVPNPSVEGVVGWVTGDVVVKHLGKVGPIGASDEQAGQSSVGSGGV